MIKLTFSIDKVYRNGASVQIALQHEYRENDQKRPVLTNDHEWIDFKGAVAYTGNCSFKLIWIKEIHQIVFNETLSFKKKEEVIATICYNDYKIKVYMPVDGKVLQINETILTGKRNILLPQPVGDGWSSLIVPPRPYKRNDLLLPKPYQINGKSKYAR